MSKYSTHSHNHILFTYLFLKTNFRLEKYLTLLRPEYRKSICRLRVSAHRLFIEMDSYNNTPRTERICKNCMRNEIEDEEHFIIRCNKFTKERLFWILNCEELDILNSLGRFLQISYLIDIYIHLYYYCKNNHILKLHSKIQNVPLFLWTV